MVKRLPPNPFSPRPASLLLVLAAGSALAQIAVEGVEDREVYTDRVTFRVPPQAGWDTSAELNGSPVPVGPSVDVDRPDYYELSVERRSQSSGTRESAVIRFIVRASARGNSEWGLSPWVPYPPIPSAAAELAGARLRLVAPAALPLGIEIPLIAFVEDAPGRRVGVNGALAVAEFPGHSVEILRGVGSGFLPAPARAGLATATGRIGSLEAVREIQIEASTPWQPVAGTLGSSTDWGEEARIHVTGDLTVAAGRTLTVGAGSVVRLAPAVEIRVEGTLRVQGTAERPVLFTPERRSAPWGGILFPSSGSQAVLAGAIFTGSGADPDWFDNNPGSGSSHRDEQPLLWLQGGARATLTDCYLIDNQGQAGHGEGSFLTMTRCLVQRCITTGQYNGGAVVLRDCALVEFPSARAPFEDRDNDGLYLTGGAHQLTGSLLGWALDDGIDAGSGAGGTVEVTDCWFESCYHEGMAWSEDRRPTVTDTVAINCGQGIECGFGSPSVLAQRCLSTANLVGARFGDNYDWDYNGFLEVVDSLLLHNRRDVWGRAWDDWSYHLAQMDIRDNLLSAPHPQHPDNDVWDPGTDASRLVPFLPAAEGAVGIGIATWEGLADLSVLAGGAPVRLSTFTTRTVSVDYAADAGGEVLAQGTLEFLPGESVKRIEIQEDLSDHDLVRVVLENPVNAEITGEREVFFARRVSLIPAGAVWRYLDTGRDQGTAWREPGFDDSSWPSGPAELGYGDGDEATVIQGGPSGARYPTVYFRHRFEAAGPGAYGELTLRLLRDDGAMVHLNGTEVYRSNMPAGTVSYSTLAASTQSGGDEEAFHVAEIDPELLVPGTNLVAVEVHQADATSSDVSFDFELTAQLLPQLGVTFMRGEANGDGNLDLSDAVRILLVLFAGRSTTCEDALDVDDSGRAELTDAVVLLNYLFRGGVSPAEPLRRCGTDLTADDLGCDAYARCP